ncbi:MAG: hypothetical protein P1U56_17155 [Saprospiraceae bacterium]|nr:hypothetical protein [Saprospiraceae bacterium]
MQIQRPINIFTKETYLQLEQRRYRIYLLGGWGVRLNEFDISIRNTVTKEMVSAQKAFWKVQSYAYHKRAKRILIIDVPIAGKYRVLFHYPHSLRVTYNNLLISNNFFNPLPTYELDVLFSTKEGMFSVS